MLPGTINEQVLKRSIKRAKEKGIIIPTLMEQKEPKEIPDTIKEGLSRTGLWDVDPLNLFRITWKNQPVERGGLFGDVNYVEVPKELTGVRARILALVGRYFPTGAHKVGASYACLVPRLVTGQFDPTTQQAVWPSTGNYCRGGAYTSRLLGCRSVAILPEGMSEERFTWLRGMADEVIKTPGTESNVKEIFDKCKELEATRKDAVIFNQFQELYNHLWHYEVTGGAMEEVLAKIMGPMDRFAGLILSSGSAGTLGAGDYLKEIFPQSFLGVAEALQCPTLLYNGFGEHRIEGIGDKHVPWIHNVRNTDFIIGIDDRDTMSLLRLFQEGEGQTLLKDYRSFDFSLMGISGVANLLGAIKMAKYLELNERDILFTVFTDSFDLYSSRLREMENLLGPYHREQALRDLHQHLYGIRIDHVQELGYYDKKRIHQLKYFTWVEQLGKEVKELKRQWYDHEEYWGQVHRQGFIFDKLIKEFNQRTGLL